MVVWLSTGLVLFSLQSRLAPRYLDAFTPAVAIALGVGLVVVVRRASQPLGVGALAVVLIVVIAQGVAVTGAQASATDPSTALESAVAIVLLALTLLVAALRVRTYVFALRGAHAGAPRARPNIVAPVGTGGPPARRGAWLLGLLSMSALLALPVAADVHLIDNHSGDQAITPRFHTGLVGRIDRYLDRHDRVRRYELAASAPTVAAPFIVADHRPLLLLTTYNGRPLTTLAQLQQSVARGEVRYLVTRGACPNLSHPELPACAAAVRWAMAHGRDVTGQVSRGHRGELYQLG